MKCAKSLLALAMIIVAAAQLRAEGPPAAPSATQPAEDAAIAVTDGEALKAAMGQLITVEGVIESAAWSSSGKVMNVTFKDVPEGLLLVVFEKNKDKFDAVFSGDVAAAWTGAKVKVTGKLAEYGGRDERMKGRPQIILQNTEQVTIVEPPPAK